MTSVDRSIRFAWRCMADGCNATRCHRFGCGRCRLWLRVIIKWPIIFPSTLRSQIGRVSLTVVSVNFLRRMFLNLNNTYFNIGCKLMDRSNLVLTRLLVRRVIAIFKKICLKDSKDSIIINDDWSFAIRLRYSYPNIIINVQIYRKMREHLKMLFRCKNIRRFTLVIVSKLIWFNVCLFSFFSSSPFLFFFLLFADNLYKVKNWIMQRKRRKIES